MKKQLFQVMDVMDFEVNKEHLEHVSCAANYSLSESGAYRKTYLHSSAHQLRGVRVAGMRQVRYLLSLPRFSCLFILSGEI